MVRTMSKLIFKIRSKFLVFDLLFGQKHYMKVIKQIYKKTNVVFDGAPKYIDRNCSLDCFGKAKIYIGDGSVLTSNVLILTHDYSIDCGLVSIEKENKEREAIMYKDVIIGKNTFVGQRSVVLPGVSIGDNCIIGAGCVVSKNIPNDSIVVGNPCKIIKNTKEWALDKYKNNLFELGNKRI